MDESIFYCTLFEKYITVPLEQQSSEESEIIHGSSLHNLDVLPTVSKKFKKLQEFWRGQVS